MMSAAQSPTTLESKLEALQCHFTWDLDLSRSRLSRLRDKLEDIGTEEGNSWLGHIYNLQGFIQYKLGFTEDAQSLFNKAAEAFTQTRGAAEGPWLVVNYGNLAWLHHHLGDQAESQAYLSKVDALMEKYPSPSQDELHPEIYAEKAWTLMRISTDKKQLAVDYFQRAIRMQPDMVEWNTSRILALVTDPNNNTEEEVGADIVEEMKIAKEQDPENLYLAALYLEQRAIRGERIEDEARELSRKVLRNPVSSYSGMKPLLWVYKDYVSKDEAIDLAEEALKKHPDSRYLKSCAALCYKWKINSLRDRAISLQEEVNSLYPHSSFLEKMKLANMYAKSTDSQAEAEPIYQELLQSNLELTDKQGLYNSYAKYLLHYHKDYNKSVEYNMKAAEIPEPSFFRENSISILEKIRDRNRHQMCREVEEFLANLQKIDSSRARAISLQEEVIPLYPDSSFLEKLDLANKYAKSTHNQAEAEPIYQQLLESDLEPAERQMLYNNYAKYLLHYHKDYNRSVEYNMMAAKIPEPSYFRKNSISILEKIRDRHRHPMCREIEEFLANLQEP